MVFHWSLSDCKSLQVFRTRLGILAVLSNAVVWIVSTRPPTSKSSRPFNNPLVIVPNAPITIDTIVTFMFHSFFNSQALITFLRRRCPWCNCWRCPWCNYYRRRKWTRRHEFKSWTRLIAFHIARIPLGKVWIQLFSLQLWANSKTD